MEKLSKYVAFVLIGLAILFGIIKLQKKPTIHPKEINSTITTPYQATIKRLPKQEDSKADPLGLKPNSVLEIKIPNSITPTRLIYQKRALKLHFVAKDGNYSIYQTEPLRTQRKAKAAIELEFTIANGLFVPKEAVVQRDKDYYVFLKDRGEQRVTIIKQSPKGYIVSGIEKNATLLLP